MNQFRKLLPGGKREPKVLVVFANRRDDCDRLIRHFSRVASSPASAYPIHVYCLEKPFESQRCARVEVDPDPRRLARLAREQLSDCWVALSATAWNRDPKGASLKLLPLTLPPFRGIVINENGDVFQLRLFPVARHMVDRSRQWFHQATSGFRHWADLKIAWPARHGVSWMRRKVKVKLSK